MYRLVTLFNSGNYRAKTVTEREGPEINRSTYLGRLHKMK